MSNFICACCDKNAFHGVASPDGVLFCSLECACYGGRFSIRTGWINDGQEVHKHGPKTRGGYGLDADDIEEGN